MIRLHIICEGQTEETFINEILGPHLAEFDVFPYASLVGMPGHKGGRVTTARMTWDIRLRLVQDSQAWCSTFFDFYGLDSKFVGKHEANVKTTFNEKAQAIETALKKHVLETTNARVIRRFIPYVQMYEFEGLLFSDAETLAACLGVENIKNDLISIKNSFNTPEEINDSRLTAPSKRILKLIPHYEKPLYGSLAALEIGLREIRRECKRFDHWVRQLENLGKDPCRWYPFRTLEREVGAANRFWKCGGSPKGGRVENPPTTGLRLEKAG